MMKIMLTILLSICVFVIFFEYNDNSLKSLYKSEQPIVSMKEWNQEETDADKNGNIKLAARLINADDNLSEKVLTITRLNEVMERPWEYYGKVIKVSGKVKLAKGQPLKSDTKELLDGGTDEVVICAGQALIDVVFKGSARELENNSFITVYGYPVGLVGIENSSGNEVQQMVIVGVIEK